MNRIFLGFFLNIAVVGFCLASDDKSESGLAAPHVAFLQTDNLTPRLLVSKTVELVTEMFEQEEELIRRFMASRDIPPSGIPSSFLKRKAIILVSPDANDPNCQALALEDWPDGVEDYFWSSFQKLDFKDADYFSLLSYVSQRHFLLQFMLKHYKPLHLNTSFLKQMSLFKPIISALKEDSKSSKLSLIGHFMKAYSSAYTTRTKDLDKGQYELVHIRPELGIFSKAEEMSTGEAVDWRELAQDYYFSRQLLLYDLSRQFVPGATTQNRFAGSMRPVIDPVPCPDFTLDGAVPRIADYMQRHFNNSFLDSNGQLITPEDSFERFCSMIKAFYFSKEQGFSIFARMHGMSVLDAPKELFSRRLVIILNKIGGEPFQIDMEDLNFDHLRSEFEKAGVTKATVREMMRYLLLHGGFEAYLSQSHCRKYSETLLNKFTEDIVEGHFDDFKTKGKEIRSQVRDNVLEPALKRAFPGMWERIKDEYEADSGGIKIETDEIVLQVEFDCPITVESIFRKGDGRWGKLAMAYKVDELLFLEENFDEALFVNKLSAEIKRLTAEMEQQSKSKVAQVFAPNAVQVNNASKAMLQAQAAYKRDPRASDARLHLSKQAKRRPGKTAAVTPQAPVISEKERAKLEAELLAPPQKKTSAASKAVKKAGPKKAAAVAVVVPQPVVELEPIEEIITPKPAPTPTIEGLQQVIATIKESESTLKEELEAAKAWGEGLRAELEQVTTDKSRELKAAKARTAELEKELQKAQTHISGKTAKLDKVRQDLEVANKAVVQAETALAEAEEKHAQDHAKQLKKLAALKAKGERDFRAALYRVKMLKVDNASGEKSLQSEKAAHRDTAAKLAAAEEELKALKSQLAASKKVSEEPTEEILVLRQQVKRLEDANLAFQNTLALGGQQYAVHMSQMQLAVDTEHAEVVRLTEELKKARAGEALLQPTSKNEIQLAENAAAWKKAYEALKEQEENNRLLIRELKKKLGQETTDSSHSE